MFFLLTAGAQQPVVDTAIAADTVQQTPPDTIRPEKPLPARDSFSVAPWANKNWRMPDSIAVSSPFFKMEVLKHHPWFAYGQAPITLPASNLRVVKGKDLLFYMIVLLLICFAILRRVFAKYLADLFRLFFKTTLKQRQTQEQLIQTPLPSLLLNGFFVVAGGLYVAFLLQHFQIGPVNNFWLMALYGCVGLAAAYLVKFIGLKISGWLFGMVDAADSYIFIVFIVNKMMGILLLPFLVLLAFSTGSVYSVSLTLSWCLLAGLLGYRFILTYSAIRNQVRVNVFHFFLYLLAFEIAPLLIVYKGLLLFFGITA